MIFDLELTQREIEILKKLRKVLITLLTYRKQLAHDIDMDNLKIAEHDANIIIRGGVRGFQLPYYR